MQRGVASSRERSLRSEVPPSVYQLCRPPARILLVRGRLLPGLPKGVPFLTAFGDRNGRSAIYHAILFLSHGPYSDAWETVRILTLFIGVRATGRNA